MHTIWNVMRTYLTIFQNIQFVRDMTTCYVPWKMLHLIVREKMCNFNSHACTVDWVCASSSKTFNLCVTRLHHHCWCTTSVLWLHGKYADAPDCAQIAQIWLDTFFLPSWLHNFSILCDCTDCTSSSRLGCFLDNTIVHLQCSCHSDLKTIPICFFVSYKYRHKSRYKYRYD